MTAWGRAEAPAEWEGGNALMKMANRERKRKGPTQKEGRGGAALSVPALFSFQKLLRFRMLNYGH